MRPCRVWFRVSSERCLFSPPLSSQQYVDKFGFHIVAKEHPHREFFVIQMTTKEDYVEIDGTSGTALSNGLYMW